jgi:two-component system sensor histidine kinase VicK
LARTTERTEVISGPGQVSAALLRFFQKTKQRMDICTSSIDPRLGEISGAELAEAYEEVGRRGAKLRLLTEITKENAQFCRGLLGNIELTHLDGLSGNFGISDSDYLATPGAELFTSKGTLIHSKDPSFVKGQQAIFDTLWAIAVPGEEKIWELEGLIPPQKFKILRSSANTIEALSGMIRGAKKEVLLLVPTPGAFHRLEGLGIVDSLDASARRGVKVKVLSPIDADIRRRYRISSDGHIHGGRIPIDIMSITEAKGTNAVTILISDRSASLVVEEWDPSMPRFAKVTGIAVYSTSEPTVQTNIRFFERVRDDTRLEVSEARSRRTAELMQDIMAHDIRNYNQIALLNAELALEQSNDETMRKNIGMIVRAIEGSTALIQRTKTLGRIISEDNHKLSKVGLKASLERSIALVRKANPKRRLKISIGKLPAAKVRADQLLDEVFVNLLTNSVKYTTGETVPIEIAVDEVKGGAEEGGRRYWKVTIADHGPGIPDSLKDQVTRRYLEAPKGSGLGLSIVRALVVDRYSGKLVVKNRVSSDYSQGTNVETWFPRAT